MRLVSLIVTKTSVELQRMIQGVGIDRGDKIYYEDFELFFYQLFSEMEKNNLDKEQYLEHGNENVEILRKIQAANQCLKIMRSMIDQLPALIKCQNDLAAFLKVKPGLNTLIWTIQKLEINQLVISLIPKIEQVATNFYLHSINQLDSVDPKHVLLFKNDSNTLQDEIGKYWINFIKRKADIQQTILFEN